MQKFLQVQDLIDEGEKGPIWVINRSRELYDFPADLYLTVVYKDERRPITIPATWLPIQITEQVPRKYILDSPYFSESIQKNLLGVISEADAAALLRRPGVQQEKKRLRDIQEAVRVANQAKGISTNVSVTNPNEEEETRENSRMKNVSLRRASVTLVDEDADTDVDVEPDNDVSPTFQGWVLKLNRLKPDDAVNTVRGYGDFSESELEFLADKCQVKRVVNMAKRTLQKLRDE